MVVRKPFRIGCFSTTVAMLRDTMLLARCLIQRVRGGRRFPSRGHQCSSRVLTCLDHPSYVLGWLEKVLIEEPSRLRISGVAALLIPSLTAPLIPQNLFGSSGVEKFF